MPHINRIRVNNVKYNFGTQYYDDFLMRFSGKNTIYDLANGGGKSVLMLLLLQNLIPNCTLDEKQPIEKLFRTNNGSKTIHSLIEWRLSDCDVKENYKYMLTGFCARKAKDDSLLDEEEHKDTAGIEYFNYCIFYREFNDNDIKNLPLSNGNERITYNGLKTYLRELSKKDLSLKIYIFERKGEYQRFIANYGLYESEWEIIRGINKTEGHVRTYFETNYKTTRKVVEDLLIEEIIQKSFNIRTYSEGSEDVMAKTLIDIKDKLLELSKRKDEIVSLDREIEMIESFIGRVQSVKEMYYGKDDLSNEIIKGYYTVKKAINDNETKRNGVLNHIESLKRDEEFCVKQIETVKVQKDINDREKLLDRLELAKGKLADITDKYEKEKENLTIRECINDYCDYLYYKKERDELQALVDNILRDKSDIVDELHILASTKMQRNKAEIVRLSGEIEKEQKIIDMEESMIGTTMSELDDLKKEEAVNEYLVKDYNERSEKLREEINTLKSSYDDVIGFDIERYRQEQKKKVEELAIEQECLSKEISDISEKLSDKKREEEEIAIKENDNDNALTDNILLREKLSDIKQKAQKLMEIYGESDIKKLFTTINQKYQSLSKEIADNKAELAELTTYYEELSKGCPVKKTEVLLNVYDYIVRYHGKVAVLGEDFIQAVSVNERKEILEKNPLIPYGIIIKENYHTILADSRISELTDGEYAVPLIRYESIKNKDYPIDSSNLSFAMEDINIFCDDDMIAAKALKVKEQISSITFKIDTYDESLALLRDDSAFAGEFTDVYFDRIEEADMVYENLKLERKSIEGLKEGCVEKINEYSEQLEKLNNKNEQIIVKLSEETEKLEVINKIADISFELSKVNKECDRCEINLSSIKQKSVNIEARLEASKNQLEERKHHVQLMKKNINQIKEIFDNEYKQYFREDITDISDLDDDTLQTRFMGLKKAMESENVDVKDKVKLISNYDIAMEKSLQAIDYNGIFVDDIKKIYESTLTDRESNEKLKELKKNLDLINKEKDIISEEVTKLGKAMNRLEGSIDYGKSSIEEKYGTFEEIVIESGDFDSFILAKSEEMKQNEIKIKELTESIRDFERSSNRFAILERDIEKIVSAQGINIGNSEQLFESVLNIEEKISNIVEKYDKFLKEMYDKKEEFEKEKRMLTDLFMKMGADKLADEIDRNVVMPSGVANSDELITALSEINECIALEKDRIIKSIDDMEKIKASFENQCIQTCINIKTELDRLPKLSKIFMDNETISIIDLNIPYVKEEEYKINMENYIDEIVKTVDNIRSDEDKVKYIKTQLSFKKLFQVIVKDMNAIKLTLYKRERIKEQSRYLKYEEAVGSTGQSQGIYIQFLIAIINYITNINKRASDGPLLRKVIFIDNPFGAAKDVYIWEPIFKLLKTNNVQLIVPCRGATPAITGRFDVNYILGQKLVDGRQQTVVVDYVSNVDNEQMDYTTLSYEQASLF